MQSTLRPGQLVLSLPDWTASFDYLVGEREQLVWSREAQRLGGFEIDDELESRRLLDRQVGRTCTLEDFSGVDPGPAVRLADTRSVRYQACGWSVLARG